MSMSVLDALPNHIRELIRSASFAEYATVSAAGVPIDTPVLIFPSEDLRSVNLTTGLSYPAKAERARRNPRVGLLIEGGPSEPVISIAGMAAVRDSDLQANVNRYLAEAAYSLAHGPDWSLARRAVWYWTRVLVEITPACVLWWDNPTAMDQPPRRWEAPAGTVFPQSDPPPPGKTGEAAKWEERPWQQLAAQALNRKVPGYLSVIDAQGFPRPLRAPAIALTDSGFTLEMPLGIPWRMANQACLTFGGIETFLGEVSAAGNGRICLKVARALPIFPMTQDMKQLWEPTDDTREQLMRRLREETQRRGQPIPAIALDRPPPSEGYKRRMERRRASVAR